MTGFVDPSPESELEVTLDHPSRTLNLDRVEATLRRALEGEGFTVHYLGVVLTDRATVHDLNRTYLDHDYPTDVVSFSLDEEATAQRVVDGEVYVDLDMAAERAPEFGTDYETEAVRYALHGLLHLTGYDDASDADREAMRRLEDRYLVGETAG